MRLGAKYDGVLERIGARLNLIPVPVGVAMFGMPSARALQVAQRAGVFTELATGPAGAAELAERLGLKEQGTRRLLDVLVTTGQLELQADNRYRMPPRTAKWLNPSSGSYVGEFLADTTHYWEWWEGLEALVRDGSSIELHDKPPDDPYWRSYITGQYQLARLSSTAVARAVGLPRGARSLLDVAGAHGEFSMALCRRHSELEATVIDLPGSARIGTELVASQGMSDRVRHVEGNMFEAEFGGPHDGALVFNIVHHLSPEQSRTLFEKVARTLRPGAPLCVLDLYDRAPGAKPDTGSYLGLFFHLTSGADLYSQGEVGEWMSSSGFGRPRARTLPQLPGLALLRAERAG